MANRNYSPLHFALEKNVVTLSARVVFDTNGSPILDPINSKGIAAIHSESVSFTGATSSGSSTIGTISSFRGIYTGMNVTSSATARDGTMVTALRAGVTLSVGADKPFEVNDPVSFVASGGRYRIQFGAQEVVRLDTYNKIMYTQISWHETTSSANGTATSVALNPIAPQMFVVDNKIATKTVPPTITTNSTDASIAIQLGFTTGSGSYTVGSGATNGNVFVARNPQAGEVMHLLFVLGNSTAG